MQGLLTARPCALRTQRRLRTAGRSLARSPVAMASVKKVNTYDDAWRKEWLGTGLFNEDVERKPANYLSNLEKKKVLSTIEGLGLLSAAEKAGVTLKSVEKLKLLSTAEKLGLLSLLESVATTEGATISSLSIPFFILTAASFFAIPHDNALLATASYGLTAVNLTLFMGLFVSGFVVNSLNSD